MTGAWRREIARRSTRGYLVAALLPHLGLPARPLGAMDLAFHAGRVFVGARDCIARGAPRHEAA
jgi:hypothetical protein